MTDAHSPQGQARSFIGTFLSYQIGTDKLCPWYAFSITIVPRQGARGSFFIDTFMAHGRRRAIALCTARATLLVIFSFYKIIIVWWINSLFSSILGWPSFLSVYTNSRDIWCSILRKKGSMADDKTLLNTINDLMVCMSDIPILLVVLVLEAVYKPLPHCQDTLLGNMSA